MNLFEQLMQNAPKQPIQSEKPLFDQLMANAPNNQFEHEWFKPTDFEGVGIPDPNIPAFF